MMCELPPFVVILFIYLSVGAVLQYVYVVGRGHTLGNTHIHSQQEKLFFSYSCLVLWPIFILEIIQAALKQAPNYDVHSSLHWNPLLGYSATIRDHFIHILFMTITLKYNQ